MKTLYIFLAQMYNALPSKVKIGLMAFISIIVSGLLTIAIRDLTNYHAMNDYLQVITDALPILLTVILHVFQAYGVEQGTAILASQNDTKTLQVLDTKIANAQSLKEGIIVNK